MRTSTARTLLTGLLLGLLLAPEALLLHRCACGRVFDCCCRTQLKTGDSCPLHPAMAHCAGGSQEAPASFRSGQEPVDRFGTSLPATAELRLTLAGWISREIRVSAAGLLPTPPVPPPRLA
jgi:hypothetical protein